MVRDEQVRLTRARNLVAEAIALCEALHASVAANHLQLGIDLLEERVNPHRVHALPEDLLSITVAPAP